MVARTWFHGPRLARFVMDQINSRIVGRVEVADIQWKTGDLLTGAGWLPVEVRGIRVLHEGTVVLEAPRATGRIRWWAVASPFGNHDIDVDDLTIEDAVAVVQQFETRNPEKPHAIGLL